MANQRKFEMLLNSTQTRSILKKISDVVTLGTFCYRDQSFINRRGVGYFFTEGEVLNLNPPPPPPTTTPPPPTHTHTKQVEKKSDPLCQNILKPPTPFPPAIYANNIDIIMIIQFMLSGPAEY